jgi:hypothetical protein
MEQTMNKTTILIMAVVMIGGIQGAHARKNKSHATYDTPKTLELKARIIATNDQTEQIEIKMNKLKTSKKSNKRAVNSWEDQIKSIYESQEDDAARIEAAKEQANYEVGTLDFDYADHGTGAKMTSDDDLRAESMADYGAFNDGFKTVAPIENNFLVSKKEYKKRYTRSAGIHYEGGN